MRTLPATIRSILCVLLASTEPCLWQVSHASTSMVLADGKKTMLIALCHYRYVVVYTLVNFLESATKLFCNQIRLILSCHLQLSAAADSRDLTEDNTTYLACTGTTRHQGTRRYWIAGPGMYIMPTRCRHQTITRITPVMCLQTLGPPSSPPKA